MLLSAVPPPLCPPPPHTHHHHHRRPPAWRRLEAAYSGDSDERVKWLVYTLEQASRVADASAGGGLACGAAPRVCKEATRGTQGRLTAERSVQLEAQAGDSAAWRSTCTWCQRFGQRPRLPHAPRPPRLLAS